MSGEGDLDLFYRFGDEFVYNPIFDHFQLYLFQEEKGLWNASTQISDPDNSRESRGSVLFIIISHLWSFLWKFVH